MEISKNDLQELKTDLLQAVQETVSTAVKTESAVLRADFKQELGSLRTELKKEQVIFKQELRHDLFEAVTTTVRDEMRIDRDLLMQEIKASEGRTKREIEASERRVIEAVGDLVNDGVLPQLDDHEGRIVKLELATG